MTKPYENSKGLRPTVVSEMKNFEVLQYTYIENFDLGL
jgi:hypothetical protein